MDITDWLPTILRLTGENNSFYSNEIDGIDMWDSFNDKTSSPRRIVLHNIDDIQGVAAITVDNWKIVQGI